MTPFTVKETIVEWRKLRVVTARSNDANARRPWPVSGKFCWSNVSPEAIASEARAFLKSRGENNNPAVVREWSSTRSGRADSRVMNHLELFLLVKTRTAASEANQNTAEPDKTY